ncbi:hypothetical protein TSOC_008931 [Tetrabaena socialis]|uniref:Uncharacterized protein n=1 Tax=Tetrabaena socialis TaxID=47790 RepID=A0A2J7ZX24_9CHLO|nr:hypothetical protein TSOC_008931 [Tetrabaena socialis]|eukprot:PNH04806.1 hypothetical protein TSOC_008931 [Tetrabaena socialis]
MASTGGCGSPAVAIAGDVRRPYSTALTTPVAAAPDAAMEVVKPAPTSSGGKDLPGPIGPTRSQTDAASSSQPAKEDDGTTDKEDLKQLEEMRNMTMEGYVEYCKKMRSGSAPPRPRRPPVSRAHYDFSKFVDMRRIAFLRLQQHEQIGSLVTQQESEAIVARREEVLADKPMLEAIASRTGMYIDLEVKDCIEQYLMTRLNAERIHRAVTEFGKPLPKSSEAQKEVHKYMKRVEAEEEVRAALARRDTDACPLRHKLPWAGPTALCELTGLRHAECCGSISARAGAAGAQLSLPIEPRSAKRRGPQPVVDVAREMEAYSKFANGTGRRRQTNAYKIALMQGKPRFRDH